MDRESALSCTEAGHVAAVVACVSGCSGQTLHNTKTQAHWISGRSSKVMGTSCDVTCRRLRHLCDLCAATTSTCEQVFRGRMTAQTIRSLLHAAGNRTRRPCVGPMCTVVIDVSVMYEMDFRHHHDILTHDFGIKSHHDHIFCLLVHHIQYIKLY